jgi:hypothetical protein
MHHPLAPLINPQPFINVKPQPNICLIPLNNAHVGPFPPSTLLTPIVAHGQTLQPTLSFQHTYNLHLERFTPLMGVNLPFEG